VDWIHVAQDRIQ